MKPNIFIGSSVESLSIAYAIQESLDHDANPTVWTQGIFNLNNNALTDLLNALKSFDFAIFVFSPDDITVIRDARHSTTRDNVLFEFGLFMGRLGKDRVFYLVPRDTKDFHLPSDLIGVNPGTYNNSRTDNLIAALGPFCNQVRAAMKLFVYENFQELDGESSEAKRLAIEKPKAWEVLLLSELLEKRLSQTKNLHSSIEMQTIFVKSQNYSGVEFFKWFNEAILDMQSFIKIKNTLFLKPYEEALGKPGEPGNVSKIRFLADQINSLAVELLKWERGLIGMQVPDDLISAKDILKGWAKGVFEKIYGLPQRLKSIVAESLSSSNNTIKTRMTLEVPVPDLKSSIELFRKYVSKTKEQGVQL
jgi:hypothetical protein